MFKFFNRCISLLVIISLLFPDVLNAMNEPQDIEKGKGIKLSIQNPSSKESDIEKDERQPLLKEKKSSQELSNKKKSSPLTCCGKPIFPQHRNYFRPLKREPLLSVHISFNEEDSPSQKRLSLLEKGNSSDEEEEDEDDRPAAPPPSPFLSTELLVKKEERDPSHLLLKIGVDQALQKQSSRSTSPLSPQVSPRADGSDLETSSSSLPSHSSGNSSDNDLSPSSQNNSPPTQNTGTKPQQEGQVLEEGKIKDEKPAHISVVDSTDKKSVLFQIEEEKVPPLCPLRKGLTKKTQASKLSSMSRFQWYHKHPSLSEAKRSP